jgi:hypothetical protein
MTTYYVLHDTTVDSVSIVNYEPNVPAGIAVYQINENEKHGIDAGTHYFDHATKSVQAKSHDTLDAERQARTLASENARYREYLNSTDWQVLRHIRQLALGAETSLTQQEYIDLENQRARAASNIK